MQVTQAEILIQILKNLSGEDAGVTNNTESRALLARIHEEGVESTGLKAIQEGIERVSPLQLRRNT